MNSLNTVADALAAIRREHFDVVLCDLHLSGETGFDFLHAATIAAAPERATIPYAAAVETTAFQERKDGGVRIEQTIYVERESQRKIVLGEKGRGIKSIGEAARKDIAEAADCKVHLFMFVKVREDWATDPARYREMGLEFPKD